MQGAGKNGGTRDIAGVGEDAISCCPEKDIVDDDDSCQSLKDLLMHPSFEAGYWVCCVDEQWRVVVPDSTTLEILIKSSVPFKASGSHKQVSL